MLNATAILTLGLRQTFRDVRMASHIAVKTCVILNPSAGSAGDTDALREKLARLSPNEIKITAEPGEAQRFRGCCVARLRLNHFSRWRRNIE